MRMLTMPDEKDPIGRQGGLARKAALTPVQLKAQAQRAAAARWNRPLVASHRGNFQEEFGTDVECYVLDDATHTPVISQTGLARAIGLSPRGNAVPRFLDSASMSDTLGAEVREKLKKPFIFQWRAPGAEGDFIPVVHGFDATILVDLCKAIVEADADGKLKSRQRKIAQQAAIILSASAKSGIRNLIWALAGYNPTADEVIHAFKAYVQEEAKKYEREFPNELYEQWHRLYQIPVHERGKPWQFKFLTIKHVWFPLAKSNGKILELVRALKGNAGDRRKKLFQFLNELGARALRIHIGRLLEMTESSANQSEYEKKVAARFGSADSPQLELPLD